MHRFCLLLVAVFCLAICPFFSPAQSGPPMPYVAPAHVLVGAWQATDGTVFIFRDDGTFHGIDFIHREIWGSWAILSPSRIGFQSLHHRGSYLPQYAIIDRDDADSMDYIVAAGTSFIKAKRLAVKEAEATVEATVEPQVHHPGDPPSPDKEESSEVVQPPEELQLHDES